VGESDHEKMRQRKSDFFLPFQNNNNKQQQKSSFTIHSIEQMEKIKRTNK